ncbi:hypothetical protein G3I32_25960 [Streptomyces coelicoflavus]|uniref:Uncharacterized protein n=1 Tax=Streptomyces coelicoflavus TaxID=285562 RepID=A0A7K3PQW7_9ACTN|nr:hypothetical protein [Streptomyces coelicoflavus]NEB12237.1 hypothetical protein [Streptomyces coelicoflavus]
MRVVIHQGEEPVLGESTEVASHDAFAAADGSGDTSGFGAGVRRDREHHQVLAMPALHQVLTEKSSGADAEAEARGDRQVIIVVIPTQALNPRAKSTGGVKRADRIAGSDRTDLPGWVYAVRGGHRDSCLRVALGNCSRSSSSTNWRSFLRDVVR